LPVADGDGELLGGGLANGMVLVALFGNAVVPVTGAIAGAGGGSVTLAGQDCRPTVLVPAATTLVLCTSIRNDRRRNVMVAGGQ
jgi:hypothetical protein